MRFVANALAVVLTTVTAIAAASPAMRPAAQPEVQPQSIMGAWVLNDLGEDQPSEPPEGAPGRRPGGPGGGTGGPPPGGAPPGGDPGGMGGAGMTPRPGEGDIRRMRELVQQAREGSRRLTITKDGDVVSITDAEGRIEKFTVNGKKEKRLTNAGMIESKASWEGAQLVIESEPANGVKLTRRFSLIQAEGGPPQLEVRVLLKGSRLAEPLEAHRFYDAQEK